MNRKSVAVLFASAALCAAPLLPLRSGSEAAPGAVLAAKPAEVPVEVAGKVVHGATMQKRRLQVQAAGVEMTIHVPNKVMAMKGDKEMSIHDVKSGAYIRVTGKRIGNTRVEADHIWVIGDRYDFMKSSYGKAAGDKGYVKKR